MNSQTWYPTLLNKVETKSRLKQLGNKALSIKVIMVFVITGMFFFTDKISDELYSVMVLALLGAREYSKTIVPAKPENLDL